MKQLVSLLILLFCSASLAQTKSIDLPTHRGDSLNLDLYLYRKTAPTIIVSPGGEYHKGLPIISKLARKLYGLGYNVVTFNWGYFPGGQPSGRLAEETADLELVLEYVQSTADFDPSKIVLVGKSLGSVISHKVFSSEKELKALVLLTPVCTSYYDEKGEKMPFPVPVGKILYPKMKSIIRPVIIVSGHKDPRCLVPMFHNYMQAMPENIISISVPGDHSLRVSQNKDRKSLRQNIQNIDSTVQVISNWLNVILDK